MCRDSGLQLEIYCSNIKDKTVFLEYQAFSCCFYRFGWIFPLNSCILHDGNFQVWLACCSIFNINNANNFQFVEFNLIAHNVITSISEGGHLF